MSSVSLLRLPETAQVVFARTVLHRTELLQRAAGVAARLRKAFGVKPGDRVGLMMVPGPEVVPSMLGIWMAGAAYVPLDPFLPDDRLLRILHDADLRAVVTQRIHLLSLGLLGAQLGTALPTLAADAPALPQAFPQARAWAGPKPQEASPPPEAAAKLEAKKERTPRVVWAGLLRRTESAGRLLLLSVCRPSAGAGIPDGPRWGARHSGAPGMALEACSVGPSASGHPRARGVEPQAPAGNLDAHTPAPCCLAGPLHHPAALNRAPIRPILRASETWRCP
ncbi:AMP-binding protein [Pyxidicoccus caerfyrddinensis]|uniref:AMP-binding protein n=1 Tax=Pyxidicoccus caerfyrddinensis TaxID=2709663 RepID=UPI00196756DD